VPNTAYPDKNPTGPVGSTIEKNPPLSEEHAGLFVALARLLSIGSYYTPEHARYQEVTRTAHAEIRNNLFGKPTLEIECSTEGMYVHDIFIEGNQRETSRVFELLNELNIGLLEIDALATTNELHEAVTTLRQHRVTNAGAKDYDETEIEGLPDTIRTTSQSLYVRTKDRTAAPEGTRPKAASADHYVIPDANLVATVEGQKLEREFLGIISGIMLSGDPTQLMNLENDEARSKVLASWVSDSSIHAIKVIMEALKETNSDPMVMEHLIGHAQAALEMTGDPQLVELVFSHLRKEIGVKGDKPKPKDPKKRTVKYAMTPEEMNGIIDELNEVAAPPDDLYGPSTADCLGICSQVLCSSPTDSVAQGISSTIFRILSVTELPEDDLRVSVHALTTILETGSRENADLVLPMFFSPLRKLHPQHLGPVWLRVWKSLEKTDHKHLAWPYLVNELLLGIRWDNPTQELALFESLSRVGVGDGEKMLARLEKLEALKNKTMEADLFHAPAPLLYPVHIVLLGSTMAREHGPKLHERLSHQRANRLANLLVSIMGGYRKSNRLIYQAILEQGVAERVTPKLQELGCRLLKTTVANLKPFMRDDSWVREAITWLGKLDPKRSKAFLNKIIKEKKYLVLPVWPAECRQAARDALADRTRDRATDERESSVDEIQ
jgi:hypothetical protein